MDTIKDIQPQEKTPAIKFENLTRRFGNFIAVNNINLEIPKGSFFGFLGPNGAGKSTTINMLIGLLKPTKGKIFVNGRDFEKRPIEVKKMLGIVPEHLNLYERLKSREYLNFSAVMYGLNRRDAISRTEELLNLLEINGDKYVSELSTGMKKKISLGAAIIHKPNILILDEPFISVDAISAKKIKDILTGMISKGVTIFMTSHVMEVTERLCSHVAIIHNGQILTNGTIGDLLQSRDENVNHTLEEVFVHIIGADDKKGELSWLR
jgi:ABC-2 type transport system ATP-binding protein